MSWAEVKKINSNLSKSLDVLIGELKTQVANKSVMKSIQRGVSSGNKTISINTVDPAKTMVLLNGQLSSVSVNGQTGGGGGGSGVTLSALTESSITVANAYVSAGFGSDVAWSWQAVEFY